MRSAAGALFCSAGSYHGVHMSEEGRGGGEITKDKCRASEGVLPNRGGNR
jgi:hypothetical protein